MTLTTARTTTRRTPSLLLLVATVVALAACSTTKVTSTRFTPLQQATEAVPQAQLLDLGVVAFDASAATEDDKTAIPATVRNAEAYYLANQLRKAIEDSAAWGAVRLLPSTTPVTDVYVTGRIVQSDGEQLILDIEAKDSAGNRWVQRTYKETASKYAYEHPAGQNGEPFRGLFNRIANDLLEHRKNLEPAGLERLRTVSELRFARDFAPESFGDYLREGRGGKLEIARLPALNDPTLARIHAMRERDYQYVDTLQQYYDNFSTRMAEPYLTWRSARYDEIVAARELNNQSILRTAGGIAAVIAGVALASKSNSGVGQLGGIAAVGAGAVLVQSGMQARSEAKMHQAALAELGASLDADLKPQVIELEDRTVTLTGNVEDQYEQWRALLKQIYRAEREGG
jgi:hypothetical protein